MSENSTGRSLLLQRVRASWRTLLRLGLAMAVLGAAALIFPAVSTIVATLLVGWVFLLSGGITVVGSFSMHGTGPFFAALLLGLLSIAAGVFVLFNPLAGEVALTLIIGLLFVFQGAFEIFFALEIRPQGGWVGLLLSGIASVAMTILIAAGWPVISEIALGIVLGVNFLTTGLAYLSLSFLLKRAA
jgi:uncharacterized membrane protein HdeD (DUF308 family)